jgi:DNA invertase Pin-like site-specific DNA recombinase
VNCLLYARVSTDKQAQKDLSIPAQIEAMREYAKKNGWKVISAFVDEGESARTANRPELKRLIQQCKENKQVDIVIVHKIDRLARNLVDYATIKAILKQKGIRLVSVSEPFDDNPVGQLLENIIASISEWYSANLGEEIKKSNQAKLKKGEWPHQAPLGYKSAKGEDNRVKHVPDEKAAPLVRQAYELFSTGNYSLKTLSEGMAERGLKTRYGRILSQENIKQLLTRRFYLGKLVWNGKEYQGKHEPIIRPELFYRVQEVLKNRSADTGEKGKLQFLLRGIAYCQVCGQRLTGEVHPRGSYYRCLPSLHKKKCEQPYTPVSALDSQLEALYARLQPPQKILELLKLEMHQIAQRRQRIADREAKGLKKTIGDLENRELKLLDEKLSGKVPQDVYDKLENQYQEKRRATEARLSQLEVDYADPLDFLDKAILVASTLLYLHQRFDFDQQKNLCKAIFERIYVKDRAIVGVKLNPPFSFLVKDDLDNVFKNPPSAGTKQDIFEQMVNFTFSEKYPIILNQINDIVEKAQSQLKKAA